ncbi:urease accessory protein UreD [Antrihabitans stalactiti]|uniref:Urease accessory protein UreD n=1 Tax=Antrihabitans stalactiti TaxID=2584121 RepID=A0A848KHT9_9NOCA|nr:urease accessory protein UreD [Antrihabitans stalactiti]NMN97346.1 urease accessory protein UreD [Antrihabitans stalactiti]
MRSCLTIVATVGRLPQIHADGGLTARITNTDTVHLIGSAATPLGGDHIGVTVRVGPGARLRVRSVAATIALPARDRILSTAEWTIEVGEGASLDFDPMPLIVGAGAHHLAKTVVGLASSASLRLRERVQIGRDTETSGWWAGEMVADLDGKPMLRHRVDVGASAVADDAIEAPRAMIAELVYPDSRTAEVTGLSAARLPLAAGGTLATWMGARLPTALATVEG